ncbi:AraC family transcriptional regulator [Paenibacillus antri]|uniref:AraC family transcriptional regulator n=1 Tax=Paenibacillus antri TaxID=2582848 RepID=A0A5R9G7H3_9BACL|nr:AraC family transcriptional regulator [Paenibacillus antri]TLS48693.1 AraC family transcriptional regulator [Paenibacillus antri]
MYVEQFRLSRNFAFFRGRGTDEAHELHIHDCLEVGALLEDELEYRFGGRTYEGRPGDVFLCRPFEPHWSFAKPGGRFEQIIALFTPAAIRSLPDRGRLLAPFYAGVDVPPVIPGDAPQARAIVNAARRAMETQERAEPAWVTRQFMYLIDILLQVDDYALATQRAGAGSEPPSRAEAAEWVGLLLDCYRDPEAGEKLIQGAGVGRTLLYREFRNMTGLSPQAFINRLRVHTAMDLLRSTDEPMIELAESSGFQSLSAFNKQFRAYVGCAPREYRSRFRT